MALGFKVTFFYKPWRNVRFLIFPYVMRLVGPASIKFKDHMKNVKSKNLEMRLRFKGTQTIDLP